MPGVGEHCDGDVCVTCGDVADPMRVIRIDEQRELALCETEAGEHLTIEIALVQPVAVGESILVHAGTAIAKEPTGVS
ncbi:hypothetical protein BH10ACT11_BH10ACT11_19160 [soil metagenome]